MRKSAAVLDPAQQQSGTIGQQRGACVEHAIDGVRPVVHGQNRIVHISREQGRLAAAKISSGVAHHWSAHWITSYTSFSGSIISASFFSMWRVCFCSARSANRSSDKAMRNESVDSAPWFSLARSGWSPSRQPPVEASYSGNRRSLSPKNQLNADLACLRQPGLPVTRNDCRHAETIAPASIGC